MTFMFYNYYVLNLLRLETITSDATLSDINILLCYVLSLYHNANNEDFLLYTYKILLCNVCD